MRYGAPSIASAFDEFASQNVSSVFVLPLYPQYSGSTTASIYDAVFNRLRKQRWVPDIRICSSYYQHEGYIDALAESIRRYRRDNGSADRLLFSFHGIPRRYFMAGDPYHCHCHATAQRVAEVLQLDKEQWSVSFQSRFGREEWLRPYTDEVLRGMPAHGVHSVDVICPGFAADCVETLEEIEQENRQYFVDAGGRVFNYIPCLNDDAEHISALSDLIYANITDWDESLAAVSAEDRQRALARAQDVGAAS